MFVLVCDVGETGVSAAPNEEIEASESLRPLAEVGVGGTRGLSTSPMSMFRTADALTEARLGEGEMEMVGVAGGVGSV